MSENRKKAVFMVVEGKDDAAFLYRVLKAIGYTKPKNIHLENGDLASLFNFTQQQQDDSKLTKEYTNMEKWKHRLQYFMHNEKNEQLFLCPMNGDSQKIKRQNLVKFIYELNGDQRKLEIKLREAEVSFFFFWDADNTVRNERVNDLIEDLKSVFKDWVFEDKYEEEEIYMIKEFLFSVYVFRDKKTTIGSLENVLIPIMEKDNEDIFQKANKFIGERNNYTLFKKMKIDSSKTNYNRNKALIGVISQLQKPAKSNFVSIQSSLYLTDQKIIEDEECKKIITITKKLLA